MRRISLHVVPALLVAANRAASIAFVASRPRDAQHFRDLDVVFRENRFTFSSADPVYFAERPFLGFGFHGADMWWVILLARVNTPAFFGSLMAGDVYLRRTAERTPLVGFGEQWRRHSWVLAWSFTALSVVQWLLVGLALARLLGKLRRRAA